MRSGRKSYWVPFLYVFFIFCICLNGTYAGTPHLGHGTVRYEDGSTPSSVIFTAYITTRPGDILIQSSFDCGYDNGVWFVQCGNFNTSWSAGDILHVNFNDGSGKTGSVEVSLTYEPGDDAGYTFLTSSTDQVKLLIPDLSIMRGESADIPIQLQGLSVSDSVLAYQLTVGFDSDVLLPLGATSSGTMTQQWGDPLYALGASDIQIGGFTTNQPSTRLITDGGILLKVTFLAHGIPSSQTSASTIVRFLGAKIFTKNTNYVISHTKSGALTINQNPVPTSRSLTLYPNWNLIAVAIAPDPNTLPEVFGGIPVNYVFGYWSGSGPLTWDINRPDFLNDLKFLDGLHGYWIKSESGSAQTWEVNGVAIDVNTPMPLYTGWNLISYLPVQADSIHHAFSSLGDAFTYVMGFDAAVGAPRSWDRVRPDFLNDLQVLSPLFGYWIKMDESRTLIYPTSGYLNPKINVHHTPLNTRSTQDTVYETPFVCDFWDFWSEGEVDLMTGDIIEAYDADGVLCGRDTVITEDGLTGFNIHVFGDDFTTSDRDEGAEDGDSIQFYINSVPALVETGDNVWTDKGSKQVRLTLSTGIEYDSGNELLPDKIEILQNYPNPFNASTVIPYKLGREGSVSIHILNALGRKVRTILMNKDKKSGTHHETWDGTDDNNMCLPSGVYFVLLKVGRVKQIRKVILLY